VSVASLIYFLLTAALVLLADGALLSGRIHLKASTPRERRLQIAVLALVNLWLPVGTLLILRG
jgi:hypothetical protein